MDIYSSLFVFFVVCGQYFSFTEQACNSYQNEHGGSCYRFSLGASDFDTSKASCASLGMHLVFIGSQDEQEFLVDSRPDNETEYWIGLSTVTSLDNAATSTWLDGSSLTYRNFAVSGSTFDEGGECFRMSGLESQYGWLDKDCDFNGFHYICETENAGNSNHIEHGGSCYSFALGASDFESSKASCASLGMHLVFIGSQEEQEFLVDSRPDNEAEYWIGLSTVTSLDNAATSTWLDGSSLTYINFAVSGSTFDEGGECFRMSGLESQYGWLDKDCDFNEFHYICETENEGTYTTPDPSPVSTTQSVPTTVTLSSRDQVLMRSGNLKLSADNARLLDAYVHASFRVSSSIRCAQHCLADVTCSCFTYIAEEKSCLLGEECQATSGVRYDTHPGAKTYSWA